MIPVNSCFRACGHRMAPQVFFYSFSGNRRIASDCTGAELTSQRSSTTVRTISGGGGRKKFSVSNDDDDYGAAGDGNIMSLNRLAVEFAWRADELARTISLDFDHLL